MGRTYVLLLLLSNMVILVKTLNLNWNNYEKFGDMLIRKSNLTSHQFDNSSEYPKLWTYGIIPYEISPSLYWQKYVIEKAMDHISSVAPCVQFVTRFNEDNYLYITSSDMDECLSYVGMKGEKQELFLGPSCLNTGVILHELMHALGFYHEHTRPDRDSFLQIFFDNVEKDKKKNFDIIPKKMYRMVTPFDYNSIMIYGETAFSRNGFPTMLPLNRYHHIANPDTKKQLSSSDAIALQVYYDCI